MRSRAGTEFDSAPRRHCGLVQQCGELGFIAARFNNRSCALVGMLAFLVGAVVLGCGGPSEDSPVVTEKPTTESVDDQKVTADKLPAKSTSAGSELSKSEPATTNGKEAATSPGESPTSTASVVPAPVEASLERLVILTPGGPLVCDVAISVAGQPLAVGLEKLVDRAVAAAKTSAGKPLSWSELVASPRFRYGQFGNMATKNEEQRRQAASRYDDNRDDVVTRDELRRFITRDHGRGGLLVIRADDSYRGANLVDAATWRLLDADRDGLLSPEETRTAAERLQSRDARDDELIVASDLETSEPESSDRPMRRNTLSAAVAAAAGPNAVWEKLLRDVETIYPEAQDLADDSAAAMAWKRYDADGDDLLSEAELAALATAPADLKLHLRCDTATPSADAPDALRIELPASADHQAVVERDRSHRSRLRSLGVELDFALSNAAAEMEPVASQFKAQFARLDRNSDGFVSREEYGLAGPGADAFAGVDVNDDQKVSADELHAFLELQRAASLTLVEVAVGHVPDALFACLDTNGDGRLGARELSEVAARLDALDGNRDGSVAPEETVDRMTVRIVRAARNPDAEMPQRNGPMPLPPAERTGPNWFQRMDVNGDGDIGPREFLGNAARFQALDANADGFIDAPEAERASKDASAEVSPGSLPPTSPPP